MSLSILIVEDVKDDVELVRGTLSAANLACTMTHVDSPASLTSALQRQQYDVALVDFVLPHFGGLEAIGLIREVAKALPVIVLTGAIDDAAAQNLDHGADAILFKDRLVELPGVIRRLTSHP